ncbi:MAG: RICIN domain-containing protein [Tepidisphaeraceae bacterium]
MRSSHRYSRALLVLTVMLGMAGLVPTQAQAARGRPIITGTKKTFAADNGNLLRGPRLSTEVGTLPARSTLQAIKNYGCNAIHCYAERADYGYPAGSKASTLDTLVQWTRDDGLYLVITIGNGGINDSFMSDFWNFYAGRYANETHVIYEIQNEAVGSPGVSASAIASELNAYNIIRAKAPNTPVLFFSYVAFSSGAKVIQDINALGSTVDWTKAGIAFHGYGTGAPNATKTCLQYVQNAGYPCVQTEFYVWPWGKGNYATLGQGNSIYQDVDETGAFERLGCSWFSFLAVDQVTDDTRFKNRLLNAGILWTPDYGTWPSGSRGSYGNGGEPWTQNSLSAALHIEAENFDTGGEGIAYHDATASNSGGVYRASEAPDLQATSDTGGGYNVGWISNGEWLEYTTFINNAGVYTLSLRVASPQSSNALNVSLGGVDLTGNWTFNGTGANQSWTTITKTVTLTPGQQVLRITAASSGFNLNWIELTPAANGAVPNGTYKFIVRHTGKAMDVINASTANGAGLQQWSYGNTTNQQWTITHLGANEYKILSAQSGKSIDVASYNKLSGDYIQMWTSASSPNQRWILTPTDSGYYSIIAANSGLVLEIAGASTANGAIVDQMENTGATNQQWSPQAP